MNQPATQDYPDVRPVSAAEVEDKLADAPRMVILDDDPTGTQTVRDLPVLTRWDTADIDWALRQDTAGFFVLTNTRSLDGAAAAQRVRQVVDVCLRSATAAHTPIVFASRSDSTLRGHFPLETDVIMESAISQHGPTDGVLLAPAYVDAGRVTINGTHFLQVGNEYIPVGHSEFARDATFGYSASRLADWACEKSAGRIAADDVIEISLATIRSSSTEQLSAILATAQNGQVIVVDAVTDDDLRAVALGVIATERAGSRLVYRIGPSFVRARVGQPRLPPIDDTTLQRLVDPATHGLVVVGSHVGLTSRQLDRLMQGRPSLRLQLDVPTVLAGAEAAQQHMAELVAAAADGLSHTLVILTTSRHLITGADKESNLEISRRVSVALTQAVSDIVAVRRPGFVVAKGGITSSDIATDALGINRAWVRGSVLPGIVSLWEPVSGPMRGLPYVVFPGNVGDDDALAAVLDRFEAAA